MQNLSALRTLILPLRAAPLLLVAIFSPLLLLGLQGGLVGIPIVLILGSWFLKYAFLMLDHTAEGRPDTPVLSAEVINPLGEMRPLAFGFAVATFYFVTEALTDTLGPELLFAIRLLGLAALPAIVAARTVTGSLASALNPVNIVAMLRGLGASYALFLGIALAEAWLGRAIVLDSWHLGSVLRIAMLMLLWLAMFSLLGGVIHARRFELGFEPEHSPERRAARDERDLERDRARFLDQVFAEYRSGSRKNALQSIRERAASTAIPADEYRWIYHRTSAWPDPRLASSIAQDLLPLLLATQRNGEALEILRERLNADANFRLASAEPVLRLVELARAAGDRPLARTLLRDFDTHFQDDAARRRASLLAAMLES